MRDAQSAFDQVIAFAGTTITADDVTTVLGLVRRDLLMDIAEAVAREDGAAVFELAARAVESGYDMRHVIRELARLNRDLLVVGLDPSRLNDPEIAAEGERERLRTLAAQFSSEDLMRAFDVLTKADYDIRGSTQPRYHLELALLRWIHLRRLVPLTRHHSGARQGQWRAAARERRRTGAGASRQPARGRAARGEAAGVERGHGARGRDQARRSDGGEGRADAGSRAARCRARSAVAGAPSSRPLKDAPAAPSA